MKAQRIEIFLPTGESDVYEDTEFQANPQFEQIIVFAPKGAVSYSGCPWKVKVDEDWTDKFHELMGDAETVEMDQARKMIAAAKGSGDSGWFHQ